MNFISSLFLKSWWWSLNKILFYSFIILFFLGGILIFSVGPIVSVSHGWSILLFVKKQFFFMGLGFLLMIGLSMMNRNFLLGFICAILVISIGCLISTLLWGVVIKGGRRWILLPFFGTFQPSELLKTSLTVCTGWVLFKLPLQKAFVFSGVMVGCVSGILLCQPDVGMTVLIIMIWLAQMFYAGLSKRIFFWVLGAFSVMACGVFLTLPHVSRRIMHFLFIDAGTAKFDDYYQILQSLRALKHGGFWGQGPGASQVKHMLPDAHTDFIFSVGVEELGAIFGIVLIALYVYIIFTSMSVARKKTCPFIKNTLAGLAVQLGLQVFINLSSVMAIIPPKGMTLPFISYGGSALLSSAMLAGLILSLTHRYDKFHYMA